MNMTRKHFLAGLLGLPAVNSLSAKAAERLAFADERDRIPPRAAKIRDIEILPYSLRQKAVFRVALMAPPTTDGYLSIGGVRLADLFGLDVPR